jgi:iron-sulfur cluster insertion protein
MITITESAAQRVAYLIQQEGAKDALRLRLSVSGGGCSGFQYHFSLDNLTTPDDQIFEKDGVEVVIDTVSLGLLDNSVIDYVEDLTSAMFVIKNPNAASACGCGNSFSI